jgi:hypothetical protein
MIDNIERDEDKVCLAYIRGKSRKQREEQSPPGSLDNRAQPMRCLSLNLQQ